MTDDQALYAAEQFKVAIESLRTAQNVLSAAIDQVHSLIGLDTSEALRTAVEGSVAKCQHSMNMAVGALDRATATALSGSYNEFWMSEQMTIPTNYDFKIIDNRLLVKLPVLPIARYRSGGKIIPAPARFPQLEAFIASHDLPVMDGEIYLFLLYVIPHGSDYRRVPDFDNYDSKWLIDTLMLRYNGDNCGNYFLLCQGTDTAALDVGTYAVLGTVPSVADINLAVLQAVLQAAFPAHCPQQEVGTYETVSTDASTRKCETAVDSSSMWLTKGNAKPQKPSRKKCK